MLISGLESRTGHLSGILLLIELNFFGFGFVFLRQSPPQTVEQCSCLLVREVGNLCSCYQIALDSVIIPTAVADEVYLFLCQRKCPLIQLMLVSKKSLFFFLCRHYYFFCFHVILLFRVCSRLKSAIFEHTQKILAAVFDRLFTFMQALIKSAYNFLLYFCFWSIIIIGNWLKIIIVSVINFLTTNFFFFRFNYFLYINNIIFLYRKT